MMKSTTLPLGEWLPDLPDLGNSVTVVKNVIPQAKSYRSVGELTSISGALTGAALRAVWAESEAGTVFSFAGDAGKLYRLSGATYNDASKALGYAVTSWEFTKWGERIIATSLEEPLQYFDMGASTLFADLAGSPPKAKHIAVVRDFVVLGDVDDGTHRPNRLQWSGFNNSESWAVDPGTQADFQDLFGNGGKIQRIVPGEYGIIFQEHSIWRMTYVGPPVIFRLDELERSRGTPAPNSVAWSGNRIFYFGHDGFYLFDGQQSHPIGTEKVDRLVLDDLDTAQMDELKAVIDRKNRLVMWAYPSLSKGTKQILVYRWDIGRWGLIDQDVECLVEHASVGYTLDDLDSILTDIDTTSISVDSTAYLGGTINVAAFDASHKLATFSGSPLTAEIETGELSSTTGKRITMKGARPLIDGTVTVSHGTRDKQSDNYSYGSPVSLSSIGEANINKSARYHRFKLSISGGFNHAQGVVAMYREEGAK